MMVILEYCGGGNLQKALKKDARSATRRLVRVRKDLYASCRVSFISCVNVSVRNTVV